MGPMFYVMAILGCADSETACEPVRVEPVRYATPAACNAATPAVLTASNDLAYPVVMAECRPGARQLASARAKPRG